jgi:hypothetical protein
MGTITTLYDVAFFCFPHRVLGVFAHTFIIYIFKFFPLDFLKIFFPLGFLKIVFILREI